MKFCATAIILACLLSTSSAAQTTPSAPEHYLTHLLNRAILFDTAQLVRITLPPDTTDAWRKWRTVENLYYGKHRGSLPMIADLQALHPYFRDKVMELIAACADVGITLAIVETYRTPAKQSEYFAMGKKYTSTPGGKSRHQYGLAVDVVPMVDSVAVWNNQKLWRKIGLAGERLGLRWGGRWRVLYDPGHFEWSGGLSRYELSKGVRPRIPSAFIEKYAGIEPELKKLQDYWKAWEVEQSVMANKGSEDKRVAGFGQ